MWPVKIPLEFQQYSEQRILSRPDFFCLHGESFPFWWRRGSVVAVWSRSVKLLYAGSVSSWAGDYIAPQYLSQPLSLAIPVWVGEMSAGNDWPLLGKNQRVQCLTLISCVTGTARILI